METFIYSSYTLYSDTTVHVMPALEYVICNNEAELVPRMCTNYPIKVQNSIGLACATDSVIFAISKCCY